MKSIRLTGVIFYMYDDADLWERYFCSLEWKRDGVADDESGDGKRDEVDEGWLMLAE